MEGLCFDVHGLQVGFRVNDPATLQRVASLCTALGWRETRSPSVELLFSIRMGQESRRRGVRHYHFLFLGGSQLLRTLDREQLFEVLESALRRQVLTRVPDQLLLEGEIVGLNGRALLLPGPDIPVSLIESLTNRGAVLLGSRFVAVDRQGITTGASPLPVALVALVEQSREVRSFRPRTLNPGRAALKLFSHAINSRAHPQVALESISRLVARAPVLKGRFACSRVTAQLLIRKLRSSSPSLQSLARR